MNVMAFDNRDRSVCFMCRKKSFRINEPVAARCVNGNLRVGDLVISAPDDEYGCLIGRVLKINPLGSPEHCRETENETDDVHVNFLEFDYNEKRIKEIEEIFSDLYDEPKIFEECPLDDVIMNPLRLIRITGIEETLLRNLLKSRFDAACYCYKILSDSISHIWTSNEKVEDLFGDIMEIIDSALALAGYKIIDGDRNSLILRHSREDTDFEIKIQELC
jgi:hypothetical protein